MSNAMVENVPQVQGKSSQSMCELIDVALGEELCRWEKLCTARKTPGFNVSGTRDNGDVWKGPRADSGWLRVHGPM